MEKKIINVSSFETEDGRIFISAAGINRVLNEGKYIKGSLLKQLYPENNIVRFNGEYYAEYEDLPGNEIFDEEEHNNKFIEICRCIKNGTQIIGRRHGKGQTR